MCGHPDNFLRFLDVELTTHRIPTGSRVVKKRNGTQADDASFFWLQLLAFFFVSLELQGWQHHEIFLFGYGQGGWTH